tara:strand:- start:315 stop:707 length:393 start_codon:yes stop_codon:yes gene_type:complete
MCRANIDSSILDISTNDLVLEDSNPRSLNISISSPKGTSLPIQDNELQILTNIFGNLIEINYCNINLCDKVVFQNYKNNCWWIGKVLNREPNRIKIDKSIYLERGSGNIYKSSPEIRSIEIDSEDTFFIL